MKSFTFNQKTKRNLKLDPNYVPIILGNIAYEKAVKDSEEPVEVIIAIQRSNHQIAKTTCSVFNEKYHQEDVNFLYVERLIKTLIWLKGGYKIYIAGDQKLGYQIQEAYQYFQHR